MKTTLMDKNSVTLGTYSSLIGMRIEGECYQELVISGALLSHTRFRNVSFSRCVFYACTFDFATFQGCSFENCEFIFSHLDSTGFTGCSFDHCCWNRNIIENNYLQFCALDRGSMDAFTGGDNQVQGNFSHGTNIEV